MNLLSQTIAPMVRLSACAGTTRAANVGAEMTALSSPEIHSVSHELHQIKNALRLMIETQRTQTEMLAKLIEAATPSDEPHPLEEAMVAVAEALRDQTNVLDRVETEIGGLGREVEAGVMRGLAGALGVDMKDPSPHKRGTHAQPTSEATKSQARRQRSAPENSEATVPDAEC